MSIGHIQDRLIHERIQVNVLWSHEGHTLQNFDRRQLCTKQFTELLQKLWRLIRIDACDENWVVYAIHHKTFGREPDRHGEHNLILEVNSFSSHQAFASLMLY